MRRLVRDYDPAWDAIFGAIEVPRLKPRPGEAASGSGGAGRGGRHFPGRGAGGRSGAGRAVGLAHNALLTQQAVVKIVRGGGVMNTSRLGCQLSYVTREGALALERGDNGEIYHGKSGEDGFRAVQADWAEDFAGMDPRMTAYTYHLVISYPTGTNPEAAKAGARAFADRLCGGEFGDRYKCVLAHHGDTRNPHTHLVVNRAGANGNTLHLSPTAIDIQALRSLHVETAREVGVVLNATSRFSRGVEQRPRALGRIHAERAGRQIGRREIRAAVRPQVWPRHGADRRVLLEGSALRLMQESRLRDYSRVCGVLNNREELALEIGRAAGRIGGWREDLLDFIETAVSRAATALSRGDTVEGRNIVNQPHVEQVSPERAAAIEAEFKAINDDIRVFIEGMTRKGENFGSEDERSKFEAALSRMIQEYEPFMNEETKSLFASRLEWDYGDVARDDPDPVRQRRAALEDAADPQRSLPLGVSEEIADDPRGVAVKAVLSEADKAVAARFEAIGMSGELALSRIRNGAYVDRATRKNWFERDVASYANARSLSVAQATKEVEGVYRDAAMLYRDARSEIRGINRGFLRDMSVETERNPGSQERAVTPPRDTAPAQGQPARLPFDLKKGIRGQIVDIGERLYDPKDEESMSPYVDLKIEGDARSKRLWGVGLPDMLKRHQLDIGDVATIVQPGKETVTVTRTNKETGKPEKVNVTRNQWAAQDVKHAKGKKREIAPQRDTPPAQDQQARPPLDLKKGVRGEIVDIGEKLYDPKDEESLTAYVDLKIEGYARSKRLWGIGLPDMLTRYRLDIGDVATIVQPGKETVTMTRVNKETGEPVKVNMTRNQWDARDVEHARGNDPEIARRREIVRQRNMAPAQDQQARPPLDLKKGVRGEIVGIGEKLYDPRDEESMTAYVDLKIEGYARSKRLWGIGLPDMLTRYRLDIGDVATIVQPGKETVTMTRANKETGEPEKVNMTRNQWDARDVERAEDNDPEIARKRAIARREESRSIDR